MSAISDTLDQPLAMPTSTLAELLNWNQRIVKEEAALVKGILTSRKNRKEGEQAWNSEMVTTEYQGSEPREFKTLNWHAFHSILDGKKVPTLDMQSLSECQKDDLPLTSRANTRRETMSRGIQNVSSRAGKHEITRSSADRLHFLTRFSSSLSSRTRTAQRLLELEKAVELVRAAEACCKSNDTQQESDLRRKAEEELKRVLAETSGALCEDRPPRN
eukprot:747254-Hanusia_phi.AAC.10